MGMLVEREKRQGRGTLSRALRSLAHGPAGLNARGRPEAERATAMHRHFPAFRDEPARLDQSPHGGGLRSMTTLDPIAHVGRPAAPTRPRGHDRHVPWGQRMPTAICVAAVSAPVTWPIH